MNYEDVKNNILILISEEKKKLNDYKSLCLTLHIEQDFMVEKLYLAKMEVLEKVLKFLK